MFFQMIWRASLRRSGATLLALAGVTIAAIIATALLALYVDVEAKLSREFRGFGASLVVVANEGTSFSGPTIDRLQAELGAQATVVPMAYAVAKTASGRPVVVVGTNISLAKKLNNYWSVQGSGDVLIGERALSLLAAEESKELSFDSKALALPASARLRTGGDEESRIYLPLESFSAWTGVSTNTLEVGVIGGPSDIESVANRLRSALPYAEVKPVRQVAEAEAHILGRTRAVFLGCMATIVAVVGLCVFATLTASVFERRKDYAVMKALGSSQRGLNALFLVETTTLGVVGAIIGFVLGSALAALIGQVNFHSTVLPRFEVLPFVVTGCLILTTIAALFPLLRLQNLAPATMLKGD